MRLPLPRFARRAPRALALAALLAAARLALGAEPSVNGQTGLIAMPDARLAPDGTWRTGFSWDRPYDQIWSSIAMFPWLEPSFRYTRIMHVPGFAPGPNINYGDYKDKSVDVKLRVLPETERVPQIAFGLQDFIGTDLFRAYYVAASKRFGDVDATLGYGAKRIDGLYGGLRWSPQSLPGWRFVAEYDANNYKRDAYSTQSGADKLKKGPAFAIEHDWGWLGTQVSTSHGHLGFNVFVSVPLQQREFVPKIDEPAPYTKINPRPTEAQWRGDAGQRAALFRALYEQDFRDIRFAYKEGVLTAELTNTRISSMPRAVGRAARTLLSFSPLETRELRITYLQDKLPLATYDFIDVPLLQRYFNGMASRAQLDQYVAIHYAEPDSGKEASDRAEALAAFEEPIPERLLVERHVDGNWISLRAENLWGGTFLLRPALAGYFNDPSGAFRYDVSALASYERWFPGRVQFLGDLKQSIVEDVSQVENPSNSLLPHVRTDIADYERVRHLKILRLLANQYYQPSRRVYARASAGIYELMYDGVGGQVLYLPKDGRWAFDVASDYVKQRDFQGLFGTRPYSTLTTLASLHYRMAYDTTLTARVGKFLAKDDGVRFELSRRFNSGFTVGAWYTRTNGNDITSPGSPSAPYYDKGIFMSMPLDTMLTKDTQAVAGFSLAPWTRDVGQMVQSPGDLYELTKRDVLQMHEKDGLERFGDMNDDYTLPKSSPPGRERPWPDFALADARNFGLAAKRVDWWQTAAVGAGLTLASSVLDNRAERFAFNHRNSSWMRGGIRVGNALPVVALGLSGLFAFDDTRPRLSDAGLAALEAGAAGLVLNTGVRYLVGRARPISGLSHTTFQSPSASDLYHSFPSNHVVAMWAAVTPFAQELGMPWLYGLAAATNLSRIGSREHWVSDTVGSAIIGYSLGTLTWEARRASRMQRERGPHVVVGPNSVNLAWTLR